MRCRQWPEPVAAQDREVAYEERRLAERSCRTKLGNNLRVLVTPDGVPANAVTVEWFTSQGALDPTSSESAPKRIASTSWTLGPTVETKAATATLIAALKSPLAFTAEATPLQPGGEVTIEVLGPSGGNRFDPADITVIAGTTVTWH